MSSPPDTVAPEQLTEQERALIDVTQNVLSRSSPAWVALAKLLRIHDRLQARVGELEGLLGEAANCMGLDAVDMVERIGAALGEVARDMGATGEMVDDAVERQRRLYAEINDQSFDGNCPTCGQRYHPPG